MRKVVLSVTVLLLLLVALIRAPAGLLQPILPQYLPQLRLQQLSGSLWQGRAEQAYWRIGEAELALGQLDWSLAWDRLLLMDPLLQVQAVTEQQQLAGQLRAVAGGFVLQRSSGHFPLRVLEAWLPLLVSAEVSIELERLVYQRGQLTGLVGLLSADRVNWEVGDYQMPLGSYQAEVQLETDGEVLMLIGDQQAYLGAIGEFRLNPGGEYHFQATLTPRDGLAPEVARSIRWLGRQQADGRVKISQRGDWR